mmetsp:Transcript_32730/g.52382  ORF Transcript_32730/g.52382 Transcript_32730/m.52382 type:complete len:245 (-) Transcript_32730:126-860(-)
MPDKYEFRRFVNNLTHPWFNDIKSDLKQLCMSPYRLLLCILCLVLMNIDEATFFHRNSNNTTSSPLHHHHHTHQPHQFNTSSMSTDIALVHRSDSDSLTLINGNTSYKQCNQIPMFNYFGSKKRNVFHTQLMIGVLFGFVMKCRLPVLLSFINVMIRSGCTYKPSIIPMFIDRKELRPSTFYGSSYKLLSKRIRIEPRYHVDSSSDDEEDDAEYDGVADDEQGNENVIDYDFACDGLPRELYGE